MNKHHRPPGKRQALPARPDAAGESIRNRVRLKVDSAGRVLIPADMRAAMDLDEGGTVLAWLERGELHVVSSQLASRQAQQLVRALIGGNDSLADQLIADRREEARRESKNG